MRPLLKRSIHIRSDLYIIAQLSTPLLSSTVCNKVGMGSFPFAELLDDSTLYRSDLIFIALSFTL
jgi:hypothetical protein